MRTPESGKDTNVLSKTPDEIKKSLKRCGKDRNCHKFCSYWDIEDCTGELFKDALALIQQLESHSSKWTNVAEHLPQTPGKYLVYSKVGTMYTSKFDPDIHKRWPHFGKVGVTHWMPRPEDPKEGTNDNHC